MWVWLLIRAGNRRFCSLLRLITLPWYYYASLTLHSLKVLRFHPARVKGSGLMFIAGITPALVHTFWSRGGVETRGSNSKAPPRNCYETFSRVIVGKRLSKPSHDSRRRHYM